MAAEVTAVPAETYPRQAVLFITDTTRWDMLSCYRATGLQTPNLDRLASEGTRFERAYTCQPVCAPARSALFTGTWPHSNGVWANGQPMGANFRTVADYLTPAGAACGYIGKWHLDGTDYFGTGVPAAGWDPEYWYDGRRHLEGLSIDDRVRSRSPKTSSDPRLEPQFTFARGCSDRAVSFLERHREDDFLLVVSYDEPHDPSICPPPFSKMYEDFRWLDDPAQHDDLEGKPYLQRLWAAAGAAPPLQDPAAWTTFFGAQSFVDSEIGRVLEAIEAFAPGAMVIYTSDHGDALGAHQLVAKGPAAYDAIARIPLIIRRPGSIREGTVDDDVVSHIDVAPTILDLFGLPIPPLMAGKTLMPRLADPTSAESGIAFIEFGRYEVDHDGFGGFQPMRAVVDRHHKLVLNLLDTDELYDLLRDPHEVTNEIHNPEYQAIRERLHEAILAWMHETRDPFRGYQWEQRNRSDLALPSWLGRGMTRQRKDDLFLPSQLDYDTGLEVVESTRPTHDRLVETQPPDDPG